MKTTLTVLIFITISMNFLFADGIEPLGNPREISTLDHLLWISTNSSSWGDDFIQIADIDASPTFTWNGGSGFRPIGNSTTQFTGIYDGQNFTISDLTIHYSESDFIGFFGYTNNAAVLQNIILENVNVYARNIVGGLVGILRNSTLENCKTSGVISGIQYVGGLAGYNYNPSIIRNSSSSGIVNGFDRPGYSSAYIGGLVGGNRTSIIRNSFSICTVNSDGTWVGGLVGGNTPNAEISNCYSRGNVTGYGTVGGLVGRNDFSSSIYSSYSTGLVNANQIYGGFVGSNDSLIIDSFWDTNTSGLNNALGNGNLAGVTGKNTPEMKNISTFTNLVTTGLENPWDFLNNPNDDTGNEDIWNIDLTGVKNDGYPYLSWQIFEDDAPLPVVLSSFAAIQTTNNFAQINWTTQSETNLLGYNLYRNTENTNSGSQKINSQMIYAENSSIGSNYSYTDETVEYEQPYYYWLESVELSGNTELFGPVSMTLENPENNAPELPNMTILKQNYPNPFNPSTIIEFSIKENETGKLSIFNVKGQLIENKEFQTGVHSYHWNAEKFSSGMYFYRLQTQSVSQIKKMMMMK
jgi:hypothetical protein